MILGKIYAYVFILYQHTWDLCCQPYKCACNLEMAHGIYELSLSWWPLEQNYQISVVSDLLLKSLQKIQSKHWKPCHVHRTINWLCKLRIHMDFLPKEHHSIWICSSGHKTAHAHHHTLWISYPAQINSMSFTVKIWILKHHSGSVLASFTKFTTSCHLYWIKANKHGKLHQWRRICKPNINTKLMFGCQTLYEVDTEIAVIV